MRVQRAWEVQRATGKGIRAWQDETPAPLLSLTNSVPILFDVEKDWLNARIAQRFDIMLNTGALKKPKRIWKTGIQPCFQTVRLVRLNLSPTFKDN